MMYYLCVGVLLGVGGMLFVCAQVLRVAVQSWTEARWWHDYAAWLEDELDGADDDNCRLEPVVLGRYRERVRRVKEEWRS